MIGKSRLACQALINDREVGQGHLGRPPSPAGLTRGSTIAGFKPGDDGSGCLSEPSEARLAPSRPTENDAQSIEKIESPTDLHTYRTSTFLNCQGSLSSMSSGKRPGRFSSGVQSV